MRSRGSWLDIVRISGLVAAIAGSFPAHLTAVQSGAGESMDDPLPISSLPFRASGTTCTALDDHEAPCVGPRDQPDLVFAFQPDSDQCIEISLCESSYNTTLYVFEDDVAHPIGCNDEACVAQSHLPEVPVRAGHTYFIVVDGASGCGEYVLSVEACRTCRPTCPDGAFLEGEVDCHAGYIDDYNGGCTALPYRFVDLPCSDSTLVVCGTYGISPGEGGSGTLDQDWYRVHLEAPRQLRLCLEGEGIAQLVVQGQTCENPSLYCDVVADPCAPVCCDLSLPPGTYRLLVRNAATKQLVPCGAAYRLEVQGNLCPVAVEPSRWWELKSRYR